MFEDRRDGVGARHVFHDRAHHVEHRARRGQRWVDAAVLRVEDRADVRLTARLNVLKITCTCVDALRAIGQRIDSRKRVDGRLEAERATRVVEEESLAPVDVVVDMVETRLDLLHQRLGKELALIAAHLNAPDLSTQ